VVGAEAEPQRYEEIQHRLFQEIGLGQGGGGDALFGLYLSAERSVWRVDYERAARSLVRVLERDAGSPLAAAGLVFLFTHGYDRIAALSEISARWPRLQRPRFYVGAAHFVDGRYPEAGDAVERCTVLAPEDPLAWLHLSTALLRAGDRRGAVHAAEAALRAGPGSFLTRRSATHLLCRAGRRRRAFRVAAETARRTPGLRAWLLPLTLPLQISRRAWWVAVAVASVLLGLGKAPGLEFRWWALAVGFSVGALLLAADFSSDNGGQRSRYKKFVRRRDRLRDELGVSDKLRAASAGIDTARW
jgi:tetratricopeptide (TPR) repeat protein